MTDVVVLTAAHDPINVVTLRKALAYVIAGKATVLRDTGDGSVVSLPDMDIPTPTVVVLSEGLGMTGSRMPMGQVVKWSRRLMLQRDANTCGYCGKYASTVDHIHPRSRGGKNTWTNTIACCLKCNNTKADMTLEESGMKLLFEPLPVLRESVMALKKGIIRNYEMVRVDA